MTEQRLSPEGIVERFRSTFADGVLETAIRERSEGVKKRPAANLWISLKLELLKPGIQTLQAITPLHLAVISGVDLGPEIELLYTFCLFYGTKHGECTVTLKVKVPKSDLRIPTISDLLPSAVFSEREKQEMLGIEVVGIPDPRRLFLPDDFPEGVFPWRKDEKGIPDSMVKNLWEVNRPKDRPAPPLPEETEGACSIECREPLEPSKTSKPTEPPKGGET